MPGRVQLGVYAVNELARHRRRRERELYMSKFRIEVGLSWPSGVLAWLWAATAMLMPIGAVMLGIWLAKHTTRRPDGTRW